MRLFPFPFPSPFLPFSPFPSLVTITVVTIVVVAIAVVAVTAVAPFVVVFLIVADATSAVVVTAVITEAATTAVTMWVGGVASGGIVDDGNQKLSGVLIEKIVMLRIIEGDGVITIVNDERVIRRRIIVKCAENASAMNEANARGNDHVAGGYFIVVVASEATATTITTFSRFIAWVIIIAVVNAFVLGSCGGFKWLRMKMEMRWAREEKR
jgi:hypothetical protein